MPACRTVIFAAPRLVEVRESDVPRPGLGEVLVETICSAISAGSELLVYHGQFPRGLADPHDAISSSLDYPLAYGYAAVGRVARLGDAVGGEWQNRLVFCFQPHTTHFLAPLDALLSVPKSIDPEAACLLPSIETAINLVQDAAPILGERALVLGQGTVGLLAAALLAEFPLETLLTADRLALRRDASLALGITASLDPGASGFRQQAGGFLREGADFVIEVSGSVSALDDAVALTRFSGRVVIGSWYGEKRAGLDLGGTFHRSRIRIVSSQVSTIAPELSARWDKTRRFQVAWEALERIHPERWITHRFPIDQADLAYRLLDEKLEETIQVIFHYGP